MKVFDIHSDLFTDIAWRRSKGERNVFDRIHYPRLKMGGVNAILCVFWVEPAFKADPLARFREIFNYVMEDLRTSKHANICRNTNEMDMFNLEKINIYLGLEGMTFMEQWDGSSADESIENSFVELDRERVTHAIFSWNECNFLASGTGASSEPERRGLSKYGKVAVKEANRLNWILDASHLDEASFWEMFHESNQPIIASHSNAQAICSNERNLTDSQLKAIAGRGGIIGLNAYGGFIHDTDPTLDHLIDHALYIADLVGPEHLAFGFDFMDYLDDHNLGTSFEGITKGFENVTKIPDLLERMVIRGFTNEEVAGISFNNALNYMEKHLK